MASDDACPAFQVNLPKPLGVRFTRGNDGSAYVVRTDAKLGSIDEQIEVSDVLYAHGPEVTQYRLFRVSVLRVSQYQPVCMRWKRYGLFCVLTSIFWFSVY